MFGTLTLALDKSSIFSILALVAGSCAWFIFKNALERIINGDKADNLARIKGLVLMALAIGIFIACVIVILESDLIVTTLTKEVNTLLHDIAKTDPSAVVA